ncbi:MAG: putative TetR family transcriptional regulator [Acidimicrobiales bacterium]|nr:putative TetR family transcriptional regulator [Acidimicrobiales bacterium]
MTSTGTTAVTTPSTRERILSAALTGFAHRGVEATSLDALAAEIGVRKQTILYHFGSKDDLLRAVIVHAADELADVLGGTASPRSGNRDPLGAIVDAVFRLGAHRPELLALVREVSRLGPPASTALVAAIEPLVGPAVDRLVAFGGDPDRSRRVLLTAGAKVIGMATEVEVLRDLGIAPDRASLRRRRRELLGYLHAELR